MLSCHPHQHLPCATLCLLQFGQVRFPSALVGLVGIHINYYWQAEALIGVKYGVLQCCRADWEHWGWNSVNRQELVKMGSSACHLIFQHWLFYPSSVPKFRWKAKTSCMFCRTRSTRKFQRQYISFFNWYHIETRSYALNKKHFVLHGIYESHNTLQWSNKGYQKRGSPKERPKPGREHGHAPAQ